MGDVDEVVELRRLPGSWVTHVWNPCPRTANMWSWI